MFKYVVQSNGRKFRVVKLLFNIVFSIVLFEQDRDGGYSLYHDSDYGGYGADCISEFDTQEEAIKAWQSIKWRTVGVLKK